MFVYALDLQDKTVNPLAKFDNFGIILNVVLPLITLIAALLCFFMIIRASFGILTAGGNPENVTKAQKTFMWAGVGLIVVISGFVVVKLIGKILRVDLPL